MSSGEGESRSIPTLEDVARRAGVSTATVSRCLNSPERLAPATRERVSTAIAELGYSPNFGARALAARRTNTVAAVIPTMENAIFARGLQAFQEELGRHGITLLVASSSYDPAVEEAQIRALVARGADALLLIGHDRDPRIYQMLERRGTPVLVAWAWDQGQARPSIGFDNRGAMADLARRVIGFGHRRLAMIAGLTARNDRARARLAGVRDAMEQAGLDPSTLRVIETAYGIDEGAAAFATLMKDRPRPTAILCGNDVLAVGALRAAREMGLDVPGEVSITGFDDIELASVVTPGLTTVRVPHRRMGTEAAEMLLRMVEGRQSAAGVRLETEPVLRGTLGPVPEDPA